MARLRRRSEIGKAKAFEGNSLDSAREAFRRLAKKFRRGATENKKSCRQRPAIRQDSQEWKEFGTPLHFVNYDELPQRAKRSVRFA